MTFTPPSGPADPAIKGTLRGPTKVGLPLAEATVLGWQEASAALSGQREIVTTSGLHTGIWETDARSSTAHHEQWTHIISIGGVPKGWQAVKESDKVQTLELAFDDVDRETTFWTAPTYDDVAQIFEFAKTLTPESRLMVHCAVGKSRSAAAMWAIRTSQMANDDKKGWEEVLMDIYHTRLHTSGGTVRVRPNKKVVELTDLILGRSGKMLKVFLEFNDWRNGLKTY